MRTLYALILLGFTASVGNSRTMTVDPLSNERAVRDMLGADSWARIIKIDNSHPRGQWRYRVYPRTIYALVFELSGSSGSIPIWMGRRAFLLPSVRLLGTRQILGPCSER